jgi:ligand-binding sensor protein
MNVTIYNQLGERITAQPQWGNSLCPEIKGNEAANASICSVVHQYLTDQVKKTGQPAIDSCDAGMVKILFPIYHKNVFCGVVSCCGTLPQGGEVEDFLIHKTTGLTEEEIHLHSQTVSISTEADHQKIIQTIKDHLSAARSDKA